MHPCSRPQVAEGRHHTTVLQVGCAEFTLLVVLLCAGASQQQLQAVHAYGSSITRVFLGKMRACECVKHMWWSMWEAAVETESIQIRTV